MSATRHRFPACSLLHGVLAERGLRFPLELVAREHRNALASHLLIDGFRSRYDIAVVVSNDGDLKDPIHFVRHDLKAPVGVLNPHSNRSWALSPRGIPQGSFYKPIRESVLKASQFPDELRDTNGAFWKPSRW